MGTTHDEQSFSNLFVLGLVVVERDESRLAALAPPLGFVPLLVDSRLHLGAVLIKKLVQLLEHFAVDS